MMIIVIIISILWTNQIVSNKLTNKQYKYTYISIIAEMQLQIDELREKIFSQQNGWNTK